MVKSALSTLPRKIDGAWVSDVGCQFTCPRAGLLHDQVTVVSHAA